MTIEYTDELSSKICELMAEGYSMNQVSRMPDMPSRSTMLRWLARDDLDFEAKCARARRIQGEMAIDRHGEIIDGCIDGSVGTDIARVVLSGLEWRAKKLEPKKYGDVKKINHADADGNKIVEGLYGAIVAGNVKADPSNN